ncbi:MAG TPA: ComEC/Rec2 family competence protein [Acidimicrobiia bacterium]
MSDAAAALTAVVVVLGAVAGEGLGPSPGGWSLLGGVVTGVLAALVVQGRGRMVLGLAAAGFLSAALMQRALDGLDSPMAALASREPSLVATVRLLEDPRSGRWSARALAATESGSLVAVTARGAAAQRLRLMSAGETAVLHGRLRPLAGFERRLRWRHAAAVLAADDLLGAAPPAAPWMRMANRLRGLVLSGARRLPGTPAALTAGLLVGDDRDLPGPVAADFRAAGLSHLLAVSGANVALVLALVAPALRRVGLAGRFTGGVAIIGLFAAMTRFEPSVLRASAMAGLGVLAAYLGRPASGRRLLALAVAGLVLVDPFLVRSLGFQLSVAASAGILFLAGPLAARLPGPALLRGGVAVTAAAQLGVAPIALPAFGSLPLIAFPANLLAAPAAAGLTLWGFGSGVAGGLLEPLLPAVPGALAVPTRVLASYLAGVASLAARFPLAVGWGTMAGLVALSVLALAVSRLLRRSASGCPPRREASPERTPPAP